MDKLTIKLIVNGEGREAVVDANTRLLDLLREDLGLTGTKEGCGVGECGACAVIFNGQKVNSCMVLAAQADGGVVMTVEGLEKEEGTLHPIQEAFVDAGAVQCGFCTPGMIISSYDLLQKNPSPSRDEIKMAISGNLCRCTGYKQIIDAVELAAERMRGE